jgi:hypothetical protein
MIGAGLTHDVVIHVNNSIKCGLIVKPFTYRMRNAPTFFPRFSVGDARGIDKSRWRSWLQSRFDGGAGQLYWGSSSPTTKYSVSSQVDFGYPVWKKGATPGLPVSGENVNVFTQEDLDYSQLADVGTSIMPVATTVAAQDVWALSLMAKPNQALPLVFPRVQGIEISGKPHVWVSSGAFIYTSIANGYAWNIPSVVPVSEKLTGKWVVMHTFPYPDLFLDAVKFSGVGIIALGTARQFNSTGYTGAIHVYGSLSTTGATPSVLYTPQYSTWAQRLVVYDDRLWRTSAGRVAYLQPAANTIAATWSDFINVGDPSEFILNTAVFNGKLYIGKPDGLWIYDAGIVYLVQNFKDQSNLTNFGMMTEHRGYLYFNIQSDLYRLSTGGTIEQIETSHKPGAIVGGAAQGKDVYYLVASGETAYNTECWVFNPETGGAREWFQHRDIAKWNRMQPTTIMSVSGLMLLAPMQVDYTYRPSYSIDNNMSPFAAADRVSNVVQMRNPNFSQEGYLITSQLDFGYPNLLKLFNRVVVDYSLASDADKIDIYYKLTHQTENVVSGVFIGRDENALYTGAAAWTDITDAVTSSAWNGGDGVWLGLSSVDAVHLPKDGFIVFGFSSPPTSLTIASNSIGQWYPFNDFNAQHWNVRWRTILPIDTTGSAATEPFTWVPPNATFVPPTDAEVTGDTMILPLPAPSGWKPVNTSVVARRLQSVAGSWARPTTHLTDMYFMFGELQKYLSDPPPGHAMNIKWVAAQFGPLNKRQVISNLDWTYLGSVQGQDAWKTKKAFSFPWASNSESIMLKFVFKGTQSDRAELRRYEVEWMPSPSDLSMHDFVALAVDGMQRPDLVVENSGSFISTTLWSISQSTIPHVIELSWPTRHTIRALVQIPDPGAIVATMPHPGTTLPDPDPDYEGAEIPIHLDEI